MSDNCSKVESSEIESVIFDIPRFVNPQSLKFNFNTFNYSNFLILEATAPHKVSLHSFSFAYILKEHKLARFLNLITESNEESSLGEEIVKD